MSERPFKQPVRVLLPAMILMLACSATPLCDARRPGNWATAVPVSGIDNTYQITGTLYRGAQPTSEGFKSLHQMGIRTVVNLRRYHDDNDEIEEAGLTGKIKTVHIPMNAWDVTDKEILAFLKVVKDKRNHPIFFHCRHGSDRTGTMAAAYRMVMQEWTAPMAITEMKEGGFGFHSIWRGLPETLENLNVDAMNKELGVSLR